MLPDKIFAPLNNFLNGKNPPEASDIISLFNQHGYYLEKEEGSQLHFREKRWSWKKRIIVFIVWLLLSLSLAIGGNYLPKDSEIGLYLLVLSGTSFGIYPFALFYLAMTHEYKHAVDLETKELKTDIAESEFKYSLKTFIYLIWLCGGFLALAGVLMAKLFK